MAWLTRPVGTEDVRAADFEAWVNTYFLIPDVPPTDSDLYAARCALLHSGISTSRRSRLGRARELWYHFPDVPALLPLSGVTTLLPLGTNFELLFHRFEKAVSTFLASLEHGSGVAAIVYQRAALYCDDVVMVLPENTQ